MLVVLKMSLIVKKLSSDARLPTLGSLKAVGYDLYSAKDLTVKAYGKALVPTDICIKMPHGVYGRIAPRSGLAWKNHIDIGAGVIDPDYRGNVGVVMFNHSSTDLEIKKGDRVAQLILEKYLRCIVKEYSEDTGFGCESEERGSYGFGSTGK